MQADLGHMSWIIWPCQAGVDVDNMLVPIYACKPGSDQEDIVYAYE